MLFKLAIEEREERTLALNLFLTTQECKIADLEILLVERDALVSSLNKNYGIILLDSELEEIISISKNIPE